ncbi:MAG TPA: twin-arginine translocase subunit TatC [Lacipirellula sp.]
MPHPDDEQRLEKSKMSFGEHLEELRKALFKSIAALFFGFLFGLYLGNDIIAYIQTPVLQSLKTFYLRQAEERQRDHVEALKSQNVDATDEQIITAEELAREGLMIMEFMIAPEDVARLLKQVYPDLPDPAPAAQNADTPSASSAATSEADGLAAPSGEALERGLRREELLRVRLFQPIEEDARLRVVGHETMEPFAVYIRTSLIAGLVFASPFIFYFIWEFIAAGLYREEQRYVYTYLPMSLGLFVGGALVAFFYAFEPLLDFMFWYYERMGIQPDLRLSDWISFALLMPLAFGVSFQLPLIMLLLQRVGIFTVEDYWRKWRAAVVVIAIIAMLLTPSADPYSMLLMGVPLVLLYFGGIWLCQYMPGRSRTLAP